MNDKEKRSVKGSLKSYYENNTADPEGSAKRRDEWIPDILKWIDFTTKFEGSRKVGESEEVVSRGKSDYKDYHRWGKFQVLKELGPDKGMSWIDCGHLITLPDLMTGKTGEWDIEYIIPVMWSRMTADDLKKFSASVSQDFGEEDFAAFKKMNAESSSSGIGIGLVGAPAVDIKKETAQDAKLEMDAKIDDLLGNIKQILTQWQSWHINVKEVKQKGADAANEFTEKLTAKATSLDTKFSYVVRILSKMVGCKTVDRDETSKLIAKMIKYEDEYNKVYESGLNNGYLEAASAAKRGKRKRRAADDVDGDE